MVNQCYLIEMHEMILSSTNRFVLKLHPQIHRCQFTRYSVTNIYSTIFEFDPRSLFFITNFCESQLALMGVAAGLQGMAGELNWPEELSMTLPTQKSIVMIGYEQGWTTWSSHSRLPGPRFFMCKSLPLFENDISHPSNPLNPPSKTFLF